MLDRRKRSRVTAKGASGGITFWVQWGAALSSLLLLLIGLTVLKTDGFDAQYRMLAVLLPLAAVPVYTLMRVYQRGVGYFAGATRVLVAWSVLLALLVAVAFVTKTSESFSREVFLQWAALGAIAQLISYVIIHNINERLYSRHRAKRVAAIIGTNSSALSLAEKITRERGEPLRGFISMGDDADEVKASGYTTIGTVSSLRSLVANHSITRLYIALPLSEAKQIEGLYIDLLDISVDVVWVPDFADLVLLNHSVSEIAGMPAIHLNESPLTAYPAAIAVKSILDKAIALMALVVLSPLMLGVALAIKLTSRGPVIFKQLRHGCNGAIIEVWKFRSMRVHDDADVKQASRGDSRITPVGRFIRRSSIDELPQLINVLQGRMSLVGPRPHAVQHNDYYSDKIHAYMARHRIKPGITGLAQISGCRGETETIDKMEQRVELDLAYINRWSVWLDIKILVKTPMSLLSKDIY
ncbi:undecaprenyl-phosphate glucose phosphotransferase [Pontibacterium granulatum]|uniref:undecaprenyl-phosphate glucose phosphotransferase n=1 Tax=Pontibacterium granulatum TaxID=2036029 RepID=UPI00249A5ED2|nr:undecaprenyl-phosphate glucose phosphotransferase [Pontibacterium granulatum]MDI3325959.1 undecaprenyl-phosphate glucose phosphotransferase [Pontibacterium granulatum]